MKRDISGSLARGINAKRLCTRMKKKDAQMCELRYEKKIDVKNTDLKKLRVKELRKIADDESIDVKGACLATSPIAGAARLAPGAHTQSRTASLAQVSSRRTSSLRRSRLTLASRLSCKAVEQLELHEAVGLLVAFEFLSSFVQG